MVTLNVWIWGAGTAAKQLVKHEAKVLQDIYPYIDVEITLIPWREAWDSIMTAAKEQKGPDIIQVGSTWNGSLAHLGILKDITKEVYDANIMEDIFVPAAWKSCHFPGSERISSLPWFVDIRAIYYRKDIFEELGITPDTLDNWALFEKTCKKLKNLVRGLEKQTQIEVLGVSGQQEALLLHNIAPWIWGAGGDFLTPDGKKAAFNNEDALYGISYYIRLAMNGYIPVAALNLNTEEVSRRFFTKGEYTMAIPGPLSDSSFLDPTHPEYTAEIAENCASSLFPAGMKGRFVFCGGSNLAITSFSRYPKEAWEFVQFLVSYDSQSRYPKTLYMFPTLLESFDSVFIEEKPGWKGLKDAWKYGRAFPNVPAWGAIESLLIECFGTIFARVQEGDYDMSKIRTDLDRVVLDVNDLLSR